MSILTELGLDDASALVRIEAKIDQLTELLKMSTNALDTQIATLTTQVQQNTTVIGSTETLLSGLATALAAALANAQQQGATPQELAQIAALQTQMASDDTGLAAAVAANTPGGPVVQASARKA
jgi:hypothetical protein